MLALASVLLPADTFPLPPAAPSRGALALADEGSWVEPYAVGDLQLVRQRLLRYAAGEIAHIENVMRGERREVSRRHGHKQLDVQQVSLDERQHFENDDADERLSLLEETSRTVAGKTVADGYSGFNTSYGPPTQATLNGTRNQVTTAGLPGADDVTRFAREILSKTVSRMSRKVRTVRSSSTLSHVEDKVVSVIDNSAGEGNLCAVYRWVNRVYEACVVNYGNRLIMEFVVGRPGADFVDRPGNGADRRHHRPVPPAHHDIHSFEDITSGQLCPAVRRLSGHRHLAAAGPSEGRDRFAARRRRGPAGDPGRLCRRDRARGLRVDPGGDGAGRAGRLPAGRYGRQRRDACAGRRGFDPASVRRRRRGHACRRRSFPKSWSTSRSSARRPPRAPPNGRFRSTPPW